MKTIKDIKDLENKRVILRCDFNVPIKDGVIEDDTRIVKSLKTINYLLDKGAKVIILSHLGKVKTEEDKQKNSLYVVSIRLQKLLNKKVIFSKDTRSDTLTKLANRLNKNEVLLIENTRYEDLNGKLESGCDLELSKYWASLGDIFINDAYGTCHRAHASNVGISKYKDTYLGFLVEEEINKIEGILNDNTRPFTVVMGGSKVETKIKIIENLIDKCDNLIIGGGMSYTFLKVLGYNIGSSIVDENSIEFCKEIVKKYKDKIILPVDNIVSKNIESIEYNVKKNDNIEDDDISLDIGKKTIELYKDILSKSKRVIINGPMGMFEKETYEKGTKEILEYLNNNTNIKTLVGGGDTVNAVNKYKLNNFYHISTGGGATLEYLEGKILPGIEIGL